MTKASVRCAIYTRKSSDEGLDQAFNSLDAQHEACASYIDSQRHEGWTLIKQRYDDGGISGGTLERPALQRLLSDIDAGRIQMVVVYKIDRLTRSLADFAKLVERLEAAECSFVSVTQSFNTSSSMGRLTLNVLLSFAQFEREVTAERIRDKIAASKQKGLWMGGICPLGYDKHPDPQRRTLTVNSAEAQTVVRLFELYDQHHCLRLVEQAAREQDLTSKRHRFASGRSCGGRPLSRGQIYYLLRNPIYLGEIRHKDQVYQGEHDAIVAQDLWDRVQGKLAAAARKRRGNSSPKKPAAFLLTGKLFDETGDRLTSTSTKKGQRQHRYYVSSRLMKADNDPTGWRLSATTLEAKVASVANQHLKQRAVKASLVQADQIPILDQVNAKVRTFLKQGESDAVLNLVSRVQLSPDTLSIELDQSALAELLDLKPAQLNPKSLQIDVDWQIKRRGIESRIIIGDEAPAPDQTLIRLLSQAHKDIQELTNGTLLSALAKRAGVTLAYIRTRSKLAFLSPRIQKAILAGELDPKLTANRILGMRIPACWEKQRSLFLDP